MKIIDTHVHCFPDRLAPIAMQKLAQTAGITPCTDGTLGDLMRSMDANGISVSAVCNIATNPAQQDKVNAFALSIQSERILSLGSVHPDCPDKISAVKKLAGDGINGIKLHPDYMGRMFDSRDFDDIFTACEECGLPVVTHAGYDPLSPKLYHCTPKQILAVITRHPKLKLVAAHLGGQLLCEEVLEVLAGKPVWLDTSMFHYYPDRSIVKKLLLTHDPDRILFGSDTPWGDPATQISLLRSFELPETLYEKIFHANAEALFGVG